MICALMLDFDDSPDFPKGEGTAFGRPLAAYPLMAAKSSGHIRRHYVLTQAPAVKSVALQYAAHIIDPPPETAKDHCLESFLKHGCRFIKEDLKGEKESLDLLVVLLANAPAVTVEMLDSGLEALQHKPELDSAASVSPFGRLNPFYARREGAGGLLEPYVRHDPQARGEVWYPDWSLQILRPRVLEEMTGEPPLAWLGRKVFPLKQWGAGPVDYKWQIPALEFWLKKHGVSDLTPNLELQPKPKLQPAPKGRP